MSAITYGMILDKIVESFDMSIPLINTLKYNMDCRPENFLSKEVFKKEVFRDYTEASSLGEISELEYERLRNNLWIISKWIKNQNLFILEGDFKEPFLEVGENIPSGDSSAFEVLGMKMGNDFHIYDFETGEQFYSYDENQTEAQLDERFDEFQRFIASLFCLTKNKGSEPFDDIKCIQINESLLNLARAKRDDLIV